MKGRALFGAVVFTVGLAVGLISSRAGKMASAVRWDTSSARTATPRPPLASTPDPELPDSDLAFPETFFFGTASSDFQTTGGVPASDWQDIVARLRPPQVPPGNGTDFLNRYREDFAIAGTLGIQMHRLSLEWARLEPVPGQWDWAAVRTYRRIVREMKRNGVEPMLCLNHFSLPHWFSDDGAWSRPDAATRYARYARFVARFIGEPEQVRWWLTFNEPQITLKEGWMKGTLAPYRTIQGWPDEQGLREFVLVSGRMMDAHRMAYRAIHGALDRPLGRSTVMVGFASAPGSFYPKNPEHALDRIAYAGYNTLGTLAFDYLVGSEVDFIGLNYYARTLLELHLNAGYLVSPDKRHPFSVQWHYPLDPFGDHDRPGEFYPRALYDLIMKFTVLGKPIVITENGISDAEDRWREEWLAIHLKAVHDAIGDGAPVIGYMYWALTDTWEWGGGFSHFGLVAIDREHGLARTIRPSAYAYRDIIRSHCLSRDLLARHRRTLP